jgi:hypothetical protein
MRGLRPNAVVALGRVLVALAALAAAVELSAWVLIAGDQLAAARPSHRVATPDGVWPDARFGSARLPDTEVRHQSACYDVTYASNSDGVRSRAHKRRDTGFRVVVLGSGFMEGRGVAREQRLSDRLERDTGHAHLSFATTGASPYAQLVRYAEQAAMYDHDAVLFGIAPALDLPRLDYTLARRWGLPGPYLESSNGALDRRDVEPQLLRGWLRRHSHAFNALEHLQGRRVLLETRSADANAAGHEFSRFYDFAPARVAALEGVLDALRAAAGERQIAVLTIPTLADLTRHVDSGPDPLSSRLRERARDLDIRLVNLLPAMATHARPFERYFHVDCDEPYWNERGNAVAFHYLRAALDNGFYSGR